MKINLLIKTTVLLNMNAVWVGALFLNDQEANPEGHFFNMNLQAVLVWCFKNCVGLLRKAGTALPLF